MKQKRKKTIRPRTNKKMINIFDGLPHHIRLHRDKVYVDGWFQEDNPSIDIAFTLKGVRRPIDRKNIRTIMKRRKKR